MRVITHWMRSLAVVMAVLFASGLSAQSVNLLTESFENGGTIPANWATENVSGTNYTSFVSTSSSPTATAADGTYFVKFESYNASSGVTNRLKRTSAISTLGKQNVTVSFKWYENASFSSAADKVVVQWSTDGATWADAGSVNRHNAVEGWKNKVIALPSGANNIANLYIAFKFVSAYGNNCYLDLAKVDAEIIPAPAIISGTVTNGITGLPVIGATVRVNNDSIAVTDLAGHYTVKNLEGNRPVAVSKLGYDTYTSTLTLVGGANTFNFQLFENTAAPSAVLAAVNSGNTAVNLIWGLPQSPYEIIYDDATFENITSWSSAGNINALKFTPIAQYPVSITGGRVNIGDGSYPTGGNALVPFEMAVFDDDGALGYPGTELARVEVTPTATGWVEFAFDAPVVINSGNFYLGMIQGGNYPNCAPIAVDETNPSMRSYSKFASGNGPWVPAGYNDFMIRAFCIGAGGPLDMATAAAPAYVGKTYPNRHSMSLNHVTNVAGLEREGIYNPIVTSSPSAPSSLLGYEVYRVLEPNQNNPATYTLLNNNVTGTSFTDASWATLPNGAYKWAVRAKYSNNRYSAYTLSNVLGKGWESNVTFNITVSSAAGNALGTLVSMRYVTVPGATQYDKSGLTPQNGTISFANVWKGEYELIIKKFGYDQIGPMNITIDDNTEVFNYTLMETRWAPYNLHVDDRTLLATWNAPKTEVPLFVEPWDGHTFATQGWTTDATNWNISSPGNPGVSAEFSKTPGITNYEKHLVSPEISGVGSPYLYLRYDIALDNYGTTNENQMAVEIWDGSNWNRLKNYTNMAGSFSWTSESLDIVAYTWDTFKFRFTAYGADVADINNWNIDNVAVVATLSAGKSLMGYNVYLDDTQIAFTTETSYQLTHSLCTYGHSYTACVDAAYESGVSARDCYTFTAHYLPAPRNLAATAIQSSAFLTWEAPVMGSKMAFSAPAPRTNTVVASAEASPMTNHAITDVTDAQWDILGTFNATVAPNQAVESDGTFIYTTSWKSGSFSKFQNVNGTWTWVEDFTIAGASAIRDLTFDGTYFYGAAANTTIFKMDFTTKTLVGTITTASAVRHLAYDPTADGGNGGFWYGDWATLNLCKMDGSTITTVTGLGLEGMYGSTVDVASTGGPFLWLFDQGGSGVEIVQMSIATKTLTGVVHAATDLPGYAGSDAIAGGLGCDNGNLYPGKFVLLANVQQDPNLIGIYEVSASTGGGGTTPAPEVLSYNIYRNGDLVTNVASDIREYYDLYLNPDEYCYTITAVYDLEQFGMPAGSTDESLEEGPACINVNYGVPAPFIEDWTSTNFTYNQWSFEPNQGHWRISNSVGNSVPAAEFNWASPVTNYSFSLISPAINASVFDCSKMWLDFDIKLEDRNNTGKEMMKVEVFYNGTWRKVAEYKNDGSFTWTKKHIEISATAGKALKVKFMAYGENSADIVAWYIDNVKVYPEPKPATDLVLNPDMVNATTYNNILNWNAPDCGTAAPQQFILDNNTFENGWSLNPGYEAWFGNEFNTNLAGTISSIDVYFQANSNAGSDQITIDILDANKNLVGTSSAFNPQGDNWTNVAVADLPFDGTFYAMVHWNNFAAATHYLGADEDGPNVSKGWYTDGTDWSHMSALDPSFNDCVFGVRVNALADGGKKSVVIGENSVSPLVASTHASIGAIINSGRVSVAGATANFDALMANRGVVGYNVYQDGVLVTATPITATTYTHVVTAPFANHCYTVKAVHAAFGTETMESVATAEACANPTGITPATAEGIKVYPNPANSFVNVVTTSETRQIVLVNYLGQVVRNVTVNGAQTLKLDVSAYESGIYFVKFIAEDGSQSVERITVAK